MTRSKSPLSGDNLKPLLTQKSRAKREKHASVNQSRSLSSPRRNDLRPDLVKEDRPTDSLRPANRRTRRATAEHKAEIRATIERLGFCVPILITRDGVIINGHAAWEVAKELGLPTVPCIIIDHLSEDEVRVLALAVNRLAEKGEWILPELQAEFAELINLDVPFEVSGFSLPKIEIILTPVNETDAEVEEVAAPDFENEPIARRGDLWQAGDHRILCGDACDPKNYELLMEGATATAGITDVPFNVKIDGHVSGLGKTRHREFVAASGEMTDEEYRDFLVSSIGGLAPHLKEGGLFASFIDWRNLVHLLASASKLGLDQINLVVWNKDNAGMGSLYRSKHELFPIFKKGTAAHINNVELGRHGRWRSNVWDYAGASTIGSDARDGLAVHPTVKPVAMLADALRDITNIGDIVIDPFLGSGSTMMAAEETRRVCRGMELDPRYVDVILNRWKDQTGVEPVLISTGQTFSEVAQHRLASHPPVTIIRRSDRTAPSRQEARDA